MKSGYAREVGTRIVAGIHHRVRTRSGLGRGYADVGVDAGVWGVRGVGGSGEGRRVPRRRRVRVAPAHAAPAAADRVALLGAPAAGYAAHVMVAAHPRVTSVAPTTARVEHLTGRVDTRA